MLPGQCHSPEDATDVGGSTGRIKCLKPCKKHNQESFVPHLLYIRDPI